MSSLTFDTGLMSEEQFQCSICLEIFTNPVTTPCGHNFCMTCIGGQWNNSEVCQCPKCNKRFHVRPEVSTNSIIAEISVQIKKRKLDVPGCFAEAGEVSCDICVGRNLRALKSCLACLTSYCEAHLEPHQRVAALKTHKLVDPVENLEERMCKKHQRLLEMFCRSDQTCVCVLCVEIDHKCHNTVPIGEEGARKKSEIRDTTALVEKMIQDCLAKVQEFQQSVELSQKMTTSAIEDSEQLFATLMNSVRESQASLKRLMEEMQATAESRVAELLGDLEQEITELQRRSTELEKLSLTEDHLHLLQTFQDLCSHAPIKDWSGIRVYSDLCGGTVRTAVSNLVKTFKDEMMMLTNMELKKMKEFKEEVTFDSNTASPFVCLSDGGKLMKDSKTAMAVPDNPERFDSYPMVLGERGFNTGRHYWEIQVGLKNDWHVGVAKETVVRKGTFQVDSENGFLVLKKKGFDYQVGSKPKTLNPRPRNVGVYVDYERGLVSFFNVDEKSHIFSFPRQSFAEKLYPYFYVCSRFKKSEPLVIRCMESPAARYLSLIQSLSKDGE